MLIRKYNMKVRLFLASICLLTSAYLFVVDPQSSIASWASAAALFAMLALPNSWNALYGATAGIPFIYSAIVSTWLFFPLGIMVAIVGYMLAQAYDTYKLNSKPIPKPRAAGAKSPLVKKKYE